MDVSGPVIFRRGTEDNANGAVVIEDSAVIGKLRVDGNSHFRGDSSRFDGNLQVRELRIDSDFLDNNGNTISKGAFRMHLPTQFFIGEKNFDSNVQRVIDSDYIAARTTHLNIWNQGNLAGDGIPGDGLDYDFVNYAGGGAVIIGSPSELQAGDSDTKFIVDRGNVLFKDGGSWDGSGIADPNNWNASYDRIPNLGAGARMMFIPKRGAFRVGAVSDDQWSDDKVGVGSVGIGYNTEASKLSVAIGTNVKSGGDGFHTGANEPNNFDPFETFGPAVNWKVLIDQYGKVINGTSQIRLTQPDGKEIIGTIATTTLDDTILLYTIDDDTIPSNTLTAVKKIINPATFDTGTPANGDRYLVINDVGDSTASFQSSTWGTLVASVGDIIEYNSTTSKWNVAFDASNPDSTQHYVTNQNTGIQYRFNGTEWVKSYEGVYTQGNWSIVLDGGEDAGYNSSIDAQTP